MKWMMLMTSVLAIAATAAGRAAAAEEAVLSEELAPFEPWLGTWQIEAEWAGGDTLWAQSEYRPLLGGAFVDGRVFVRENGGELYQRYRTILGKGASGDEIAVRSFNHDGSVTRSALVATGRLLTTRWTMGDTLIDERVEVAADGASMHWQVWSTPPGGERSQIMDGTWRRIEAPPIELPPGGLEEDVAALTPLLGGWETAGDPATPAASWLRTEYRRGLGGRFVDASTWATDANGAWALRSEAVFCAGDDPTSLERMSFGDDGGVVTDIVTVQQQPTSTTFEIASDPATPQAVRELIALASPDVYDRHLWTRTRAAAEWSDAGRSRWLRQGSAGNVRAAIDPTRFVASGEPLRSLVKEAVITAPREAVWAAWTDPESWRRLWGPASLGRFNLAIGGAYEWLFDGSIGGNGDQILSYIPGRMLSFSWNAPPSQPVTRLARTWVVVELEAVEADATRIRLSHLGFGDGPEWDETHAYFDHAWERVLALMAARLAPSEPEAEP